MGISPTAGVDVCGGQANLTSGSCPGASSGASQAFMTNLLTPGTNFGMDLGGTSAVVTNAFGAGGGGGFGVSFDSFDAPLDAPEPGTIGLVGLSLAALGLAGFRLRRKA
jgi:hypothetical protein